MKAEIVIAKESELAKKAKALLEVAHDYWAQMNKDYPAGAVIWLSDDAGRTIFFTRGEQAEHLKACIQGPAWNGATFEKIEEDDTDNET